MAREFREDFLSTRLFARETSLITESSTGDMDDLINKHDGTINTCWCELCYKARKKRLQDETDRWQKEKQILLNTIYGTTADGAKGQDIKDKNVQVNMQREVKIFKEHMDTANELITKGPQASSTLRLTITCHCLEFIFWQLVVCF